MYPALVSLEGDDVPGHHEKETGFQYVYKVLLEKEKPCVDDVGICCTYSKDFPPT